MKRARHHRRLRATLHRAFAVPSRASVALHLTLLAIFCVAFALMPGCAGTTGNSSPPPKIVKVSVQPTSATLFLGQTRQFQATVTGTSNSSVTWSVSGVAGGSSSTGTISSNGLYTAPSILPASTNVTVTASSDADSESTGASTVTLQDDIAVSISPMTAAVATGAGQAFTASVSGTGAPSTAMTWRVNGVTGGNATLGTIASNGTDSALYVAPASPPSPPIVNVSATSVADPGKSASASVTVTCGATNSISPASAIVALAQSQTFTASLCSSVGAAFTWDVNGIAGGNSAVGTIASSGGSAALYSAPTVMPSPNTVQIHATSGADIASAAVTLVSNIAVSVSPPSATMQVNQRMAFAATVTNTNDTAVSWYVNGLLNGNATVGPVCQSGSNPCRAPTGPASGAIDYLAPAAAPPTDPVTLTAVSHADPSKSGNAFIAVTSIPAPVAVVISPPYGFLFKSTGTPSTLQFFATVSGTSITGVTWSLQSAVPGQGCAGAACGTVDANGLYTAPIAAPSPNAISLTATSVADSTKSASATISLTSNATIQSILPSSVMAGAVESFPLTVRGMKFQATNGSTGGIILINGTPRSTTCPSALVCNTTLNPADVQTAGTLTVQVKNPSAPGFFSNPVPFVIVPFDASEDIIPLSSSQPAAGGKDITVVEPTNAAASAPLDVDFDGVLTSDGCTIEGTPLIVTRPASGSIIVSLCIHGNGLDPTMTYAFTGPGEAPGDIAITASAIANLFPNTIELDLEISSTTLPGVRTLFITTLNNDRAAATGILEVK